MLNTLDDTYNQKRYCLFCFAVETMVMRFQLPLLTNTGEMELVSFFSSQTQNIPVHVEHRVMFFNTYGRVHDWPCHRLVMQRILSELSITHSRNRITEFYLKKWTRIIIREDRITFPSTVCIHAKFDQQLSVCESLIHVSVRCFVTKC